MFTLSRRLVLLLLLTAAAAQQVRYIARAVLPAQDVVDTVSVAQRIQVEGLPATMRAEPVPPLFPALVAATHSLLSSCQIIDATDWIRPPQVVAATALILAVIPIFLTAERVAGHGSAVIATIFYIALPALARLGADGLGDAVHLCLVTWGMWLICLASGGVHPRRPAFNMPQEDGGDKPRRSLGSRLTWICAGLCIAAALLVRAEAAVVPLTVLLLAVPRPAFRVPRFFAAAACCVLPFVAVSVTSPSEIVERLRGGAAPTEEVPLNTFAATPFKLYDGSDLLYMSDGSTPVVEHRGSLTFGHKDRTRSSRFHGFAATLREFIDELAMASGYVLPLLVVAGFWLGRRGERSNYAAFVTLAVVLQLAVLFVMAWKNGYLSTRHFVVPVMLTLPYAALGLVGATQWIAARTARREPRPPVAWQMGFVGLFVITSLLATSRPLNHTSIAHRQAAEWLASTEPGRVLDQQGFTALTSGRTTYRFDAAREALADDDLRWVLVERGDLDAASPRGETLRTVLGNATAAAEIFVAPDGCTERDVLVFKQSWAKVAYREKTLAR